jgi:hypothetical protein
MLLYIRSSNQLRHGLYIPVFFSGYPCHRFTTDMPCLNSQLLYRRNIKRSLRWSPLIAPLLAICWDLFCSLPRYRDSFPRCFTSFVFSRKIYFTYGRNESLHGQRAPSVILNNVPTCLFSPSVLFYLFPAACLSNYITYILPAAPTSSSLYAMLLGAPKIPALLG